MRSSKRPEEAKQARHLKQIGNEQMVERLNLASLMSL